VSPVEAKRIPVVAVVVVTAAVAAAAAAAVAAAAASRLSAGASHLVHAKFEEVSIVFILTVGGAAYLA